LGFLFRGERYDLVLDLQRNWMSRIIRRLISPLSWSEFDRYYPLPAGERVIEAFRAAGVRIDAAPGPLPVRRDLLERGRGILEAKGWDGRQKLIVLNPAGLWKTRNWPLEGYVEFSRRWLDEEPVKFVLLGTERIREKATLLSGALGASFLNLVGETSLDEAMAVLQYCSLILTEDSGLMHMGWTSGIPTLALFGSSRHDWSRPLGEHTLCFHSGDLPCGACMEPTCRFGDVHCLTRYSPAQVFEASRAILQTPVTVGV
jgi:ADP-heptose:LPS heptosyltransferase